MKRDPKLKAFTIMEITIAMMVSAILIVIVYTAFSAVSRSYQIFVVNNEGAASLEQLDKLLNRDFRRANTVTSDSAGIQLVNDQESVRYQFNPDFIVRKSAIIDTFKVKTETYKMSFETRPITATGQDSTGQKIDELELQLSLRGEKMNFDYQKKYSSADLFEQDPHAGN
jgi:Tfp pilus assembly protein PilE